MPLTDCCFRCRQRALPLQAALPSFRPRGRTTMGAPLAALLAALLAASALSGSAVAARPTRPGRFFKLVRSAASGGAGHIAAAAVGVGEGQVTYHYCDL